MGEDPDQLLDVLRLRAAAAARTMRARLALAARREAGGLIVRISGMR